MEKETVQKKNPPFIIRDHYQSNGAKVRDLIEEEMYQRIIKNLG